MQGCKIKSFIGLTQTDEIRVFPPEQCWRRNTYQYCFPTCLGEKREDRRFA